MNIVERVKNLILQPKAEWPRIAAEPMTAQDVYTKWVLILAAIGPIAAAIGLARTLGFATSLSIGVATYIIALAMTAIIALVVDALAPKFGGTKDFVSALKLSGFSYTPAFLGGIFHLLGHIGGILAFLATLYAWYLFYLGAPVLRKSSDEKAIVFTIVVVLIGFVLGILLGLLTQSSLVPRTV